MSTNEMSSKAEEEKNTGSSQEQLNLKVIGQDGQIVQFKIKRSTPFRKVYIIYVYQCIRKHINY